MATFRPSSSFRALLRELEAIVGEELCAPSWAWLNSRDTTDERCGTVFTEWSRAVAAGKADVSWGLFILEHLGVRSVDQSLRDILTGAVDDPMTAFQAYRKLSRTLTVRDGQRLRAVFHGKLPTAERELQEGAVTRRQRD